VIAAEVVKVVSLTGAIAGGPLARIPAKEGFILSSSLDLAGAVEVAADIELGVTDFSGADLVCVMTGRFLFVSSLGGLAGWTGDDDFGFSSSSFRFRRASETAFMAALFCGGVTTLWRVVLATIASGVPDKSLGFSGFDGSVVALTFIVSFCLTRLSLNSSTRSRLAGPPVVLKPAFPRRMLFFSVSGATYLSACVFLSLFRAFLNSGSCPLLSSGPLARDLRLARKSNLFVTSGLIWVFTAGSGDLVGVVTFL